MMSAVDRIPDSSRTSRHVRKVPKAEVAKNAFFGISTEMFVDVAKTTQGPIISVVRDDGR
jgi:hypothetical protein